MSKQHNEQTRLQYTNSTTKPKCTGTKKRQKQVSTQLCEEALLSLPTQLMQSCNIL